MTTPTKPGLHKFEGVRYTRSRAFLVTVRDIVDVRRVLYGSTTGLGVALFGSAKIYHISDFEGEWEPICMEFRGERT